MAPIFWFEIIDWKKEANDIGELKLSIADYFSTTNWKKSQIAKSSSSLKSLKYFNNEADLDVNTLQAKLNQLRHKIKLVKYDSFQLFSDYLKSFNYHENTLITSGSVLSRIMNTPFEINNDRRKWIIKAEIFAKNSIHLYYDKDQELNISEQMAKQYELLKRYLFENTLEKNQRKITCAFSDLFGGFMHLKFKTQDLYYTTEIPGVISDHVISNFEEFKAAEQVYCDIFEADEFSEDVINYNPIWWSKAVLSKAKQCIIASYDKDNDCIKQIYKFNVDKFEDKSEYENVWSPFAAFSFLDDFLEFVKNSVNSVPSEFQKQCMWIFQSFPDDEPSVSCEILTYKYSVNGRKAWIPVDETTF